MHSANQISLSLLFTTKMWRWHQAKPWFLLVSSPLARAASRHLGVPGKGEGVGPLHLRSIRLSRVEKKSL